MNTNVALIRCDTYDYAQVKEAVDRSIGLLGGLSAYFSPGEKVLFKINLLTKKKPEEATTTHPSVVLALAEAFTAFGLRVVIGDSPGGPFSPGLVEPVYKASGMAGVCEKSAAKLNNNYKSFEKDNPDGFVLKRITMVDMLNDVDKVVSISKLKTHGMMTFTGAVKNLFGCIPGVLKAEYHMNMPEKQDFADALIDICLAAKPVLSFMDGITAMEGAGPSAGTPRNLNVLLASESPFHLDKAACSIISLPFQHVPTIARAAHRKLCTDNLSDINFLGDDVEDFVVSDFDIPVERGLNPMEKGILALFWPVIKPLVKSRPVFNDELCVGCGICKENCPAKTIEIQNKKARVHLERCIRCYCCQELCPKKAVEIKQPLLLRAIHQK